MASDNKITVDEPLISTDVDGLIRAIAERGKIPLGELQQMCRIDKKNLDKWIRVLEDEGYIAVEYSLRGTNLIWKGKEEYGPQPEPGSGVSDASEGAEVHSAEDAAEARETDESGEGGEAGEAPASQDEPSAEAEPEELLSQYLARKRDGAVSYKETASGADTTRAATTAVEPDVFSMKETVPEPEISRAAPEQEQVEASEPEEEPEQIRAQAPERRKPLQRAISMDTRELVNAYMNEIAGEKAKIAELRKERERLYRDKFANVEGRLEADVVTLTEAVLAKQAKIAELKERVLELPDKVDELEKLQEQMDRLREEGRSALERTKQKADASLRAIDESKGDISSKVDSLNTLIGREREEVRELERMGASVDSRMAKLQAANDALKSQVTELNEAMDGLMDDIGKTSELKGEVSVLSAALRETVAKHGEALDSLEAEMEGIARIEHWVNEYVSDYEKKIEGIEQYVDRSEDELAELRQASEELYMKKYLGELHDLASVCQGELDDAVAREEGIEQRISDSKSRITELIRDSQEMIRKVSSEPAAGRDFASASALVKERTARIKATLEEKEKERVKLAEDSRSVRTSKATAVSRPAGGSGSASVSRGASSPRGSISRSVPKKKRK